MLFRLDAAEFALNGAPATKLLNLSSTFEHNSTHLEFTCLGVSSLSPYAVNTDATDLAGWDAHSYAEGSSVLMFIQCTVHRNLSSFLCRGARSGRGRHGDAGPQKIHNFGYSPFHRTRNPRVTISGLHIQLHAEITLPEAPDRINAMASIVLL